MAENTLIGWATHTHNSWVGCTAVSPACDRCYAQTLVERWGGDFAVRRRTRPANWRKPLAWNRAAAAAGVRPRVFSLSLGDPFDNQVPQEWRDDHFDLIRATPNLDWLTLTKRPQNLPEMLPPDWGEGYPNVWLGCTAENQTEADRRLPHLRAVPAAIRFVSVEPMLSAVALPLDGIDWVICGGESGHGARPMQMTWAFDLMQDCKKAGVAFFMKQIGSVRDFLWPCGINGKGDDPAEWPELFRVQEFPTV